MNILKQLYKQSDYHDKHGMIFNTDCMSFMMNMRDGCIIAIGKGNEDWNCSAPHGAGRLMSRKQAKENISMIDFKESMTGIYTTSVDASTLDESPMAYKPVDEIINHIGDTVEIERIIKPIYNYKAKE